MSLNLALNSALSGLQTNQKGLDVVSRNIANVNTAGYTKKVFNQESVVLSGTGAGVQISEVSRRVDYGLIDELNRETAELEQLSVKSDYFERMQYLFGSPADNNSIAHILEDLTGEIEIMALEPDSIEQQMAVVQRADDVAKKLNAMSEALQDLRLDADKKIEQTVSRVNELLNDVNTLNEEIGYANATGRDYTDLTDKRDSAVAELQSLINITTFTRDTGELTVYTDSGDILVDREVKELSYSSRAEFSAWMTKGGSDVSGITVNGGDITDDITRGKLAALIEMRDSTLSDYQAQLDELAHGLEDTVNTINNRGTSYPNLANEYVGTRTFLDSATQTITFDADQDTVLAIYDSSGLQVATTTMKAELGGVGPHTIDDVQAALEGWLQGISGGTLLPTATATVTTDGVLDIKLNSNDYGLAFKDVNTSVDPADPATWTAEDATISFDADGEGNTDTTHAGFSAFFGLNDVYTNGGRADWAWDSGIQSENWRPFTGADTLNFSDSTTLIRGTLALTGTETIQDIADKINDDATLNTFLEAEVVPEGERVRLRIKQTDGTDLMITQAGAGNDLIQALGMGVSNSGLSTSLSVKDEIVANPSLISRGTLIYNADTSEYTLSAGDNSTANAMAEALKSHLSFDSAGDLQGTSATLTSYAAMTLSMNASEASGIESRLDYQVGLVDSLALKNAEISAVNLDEELAELMMYEQSYAASAKVISTVSDMFDILNSIV